MHSPFNSEFRHFSTAELPATDREAFWSDSFADVIVKCDIEVDADKQFCAEADLLTWPGLSILWSKETPMRYVRSPSRAADGDDSVVLLIRQRGMSNITQGGRDATAGMGEGICFLGAEPVIAVVSDIDAINISVPRSALSSTVRDVASKTMQVIPSSSEALVLIANYCQLLRHEPLPAAPEVRHLVTTHLYDLLSVACGATGDGMAVAEGRGLRAARRRAVKADTLAHIESPDLSVALIAKRQRITPRYLHMLFEEEGTTFSQFVLDHRLTRALRMLRDPRMKLMSIASIAFSNGFGDLSYFNRTFRSRFGGTPSELRHLNSQRFEVSDPNQTIS